MKILILVVAVFIFTGIAKSQEKLAKAASCYAIRYAEPFEKKSLDKTYELAFQLLDVCPIREPGVIYPEPQILIRRNGETKLVGFEVVKIFKNKTEAKRFAKKNGIKDIDLRKPKKATSPKPV